MDAGVVGTLLRTELRMLLRDRRTVMVSVVLPVLVMPLLLFASHWMEQRRRAKLEVTQFRYAIIGPEAALARGLVTATKARLAKQTEGPALRLEAVPTNDPAAALAKDDLDFYVDAMTYPEAEKKVRERKEAAARAAGGAPLPTEDAWPEQVLTPGVPVLELVFRGDRDRSSSGMEKLRAALEETRRDQRYALLQERGFPVPPAQAGPIRTEDVASAGQVTGLQVGRMVTVFFLLFILSGGAVVATDTLAGEKERGTLETLLTTAAGRGEIIAAKHLAIFTVAVAITVIQTLNFLAYVVFHLIPLPADFALKVNAGTTVLLLVLLLPVAALVSSVLLLVSGIAKSYKEAQLYFFPVFLLGMVPAAASFLPGLPLRSAIVLVPISNVAVAVKEIMVGTFDWPMLAVAFATTLAAAVWVGRMAERTLSTERLIVAGAEEATVTPGPRQYPRHVLRAFAVMWALLFLLDSNVEGKVDLRVELLLNLVVIFLGGAALLVRRYRLDPREALALRPVRPAVWLGVVIGAPAGLVTGLGVFRLANLVVPVPPRMVEAFSQALLPQQIPFWQLVLFVAVLPGICEEAAFRGMLLYGLHRRLRPAALVAVVGLVFGLFHVALFRIAPTAYLGMLLATVTLITGSIFPAMLWHALNNGTALAMARGDITLEAAGASVYAIGAALLLVALWVLWRNRTPYPGLRRWRRAAGG